MVRKRASAPLKEPRDIVVATRLNAHEDGLLNKKTDDMGIDKGNWLRFLIRKDLGLVKDEET